MQDPYSAMMSSQQRPDPYKVFNRQGSNSGQTESTASVPGFYQGLQNYAPYSTSHDMYQPMTMPSNMSGSASQEYTPLPAHMGATQNSLSTSNGLSRINPTTHTITHPATSPPASSPPNRDISMLNMSSPGPSTSRISLSPEAAASAHPSSQGLVTSTNSPGEIVKTESSDSNSVKSGHEEDSGIPPKKRPHLTPDEHRDEGYWEKRKKNNESAKRSREARRMKEEQIALRVVYLEQENLQLRTEVSLLKSEIEKLRCMLYNS